MIRSSLVVPFLAAIIIMAAVSCTSSKRVTDTVISDLDKEAVIETIKQNNYSYEWFVAKGKAHIESPEENVKTTCYIRIKKDSLIWMAFKKLSIEAVRTKITPDSFFIAYRTESQYEKGSMEEIRKALDLDISFSEMQDYLVGLFPEVDSSSSSLDFQDKHYILTGVEKELTISTWVDAFDLKPTKVIARDNEMRTISATFGKYKEANNDIAIPFLRKIITDQGDGQQSSIKFDFSEILIDVPKATKFTIPPYYEEINTRP